MICAHLAAGERGQTWLRFTGAGVEAWLICSACREGEPALVDVCAACFAARRGPIFDLDGVVGRPEIRAGASSLQLERRHLGVALAPAAVAPLPEGDWLLLGENELRWLSGDVGHVLDAAVFFDMAGGELVRWFAGPPDQPFFVCDGRLLAGGTIGDLASGELLLDDPGVEPIGFHPDLREWLAVEDGELIAYRILG